MGAVYRARRICWRRRRDQVILADLEGPAPIERFVLKAGLAPSFATPTYVSILDYNADDPQRPFLVMELLSGPA